MVQFVSLCLALFVLNTASAGVHAQCGLKLPGHLPVVATIVKKQSDAAKASLQDRWGDYIERWFLQVAGIRLEPTNKNEISSAIFSFYNKSIAKPSENSNAEGVFFVQGFRADSFYDNMTQSIYVRVVNNLLCPLAKIGEGGSKVVSCGFRLSKKVNSLTAVLEEKNKDNSSLTKVEEEAKLTKIATGIDTFKPHGQRFVFREFLGRTLSEYIRRNSPKVDLQDLYRKIFSQVNKMHNSGVFHRDVNLNNIMVKKDGTLTIVDFGSASRMANMVVRHLDGLTPAYIAPEIMLLENDKKALSLASHDYFSVGVTFLEMYLGKSEFMMRHQTDAPYSNTRVYFDHYCKGSEEIKDESVKVIVCGLLNPEPKVRETFWKEKMEGLLHAWKRKMILMPVVP